MKLTVLTTLLIVSATHSALADDPKVRVRVSEEVLHIGERAKVKVKTSSDGHLLVLRMDTEGRVRVLFPVDPTDSDQIRAGKELELRGRGGRESFVATEKAGSGVILAARTDTPFMLDGFVTGERWSSDAFIPESVPRDAEATLLSMVDRMTGGHFDYDVVSYSVSAALPRVAYGSANPYSRFGWAYDPWYSSLYDPYFFYPTSFLNSYRYYAYYPTYRRVYRGHRR